MIPIDKLDPSIFLTAHAWVQLLTLTVLEIVLGIDNIIIISILSGELPQAKQRRGRRLGLSLAMITRVLLLLTLNWITRLVAPLLMLGTHEVTGQDAVLALGGLYLLYKSGTEIYQTIEIVPGSERKRRKAPSLLSVVVQIILIDIVFSLDSVITAVGMSNEILIMVLAVIIAVLIMLFASDLISDFVNRHPTVKVLALAFLAMVGVALLLEGAGLNVDKRFVYFAMAFSVLVEGLNHRMRKNAAKH